LKPVFVESIDLDAQGVARLVNEDGSPGKVIFIDGALPGEWVTYRSYRSKKSYEQANLVEVHKPSALRAQPACSFFGRCGGCSMQHLDPRAQLAIKQRVLEDNLWHLAKAKPEVLLRPIAGPTWQYRYRARMSIRHLDKKGVLIGFHEKKKSFIADMTSCQILPKKVSDLLPALRELIAQLSISDRIPQLEMAVGESDSGELLIILVLRHLEAFSDLDLIHLKGFQEKHGVRLWSQAKGPDTVKPLDGHYDKLCYRMPEFGIEMPFKPTDFTQVNHQINRVLVGKAVRLLNPQKNERVLDLFCGIGNFTLPIATLAHEVYGIEGSELLTQRAKENAIANGLGDRVHFSCANLFEVTPEIVKSWGLASKWLIDPPRDGAVALAQALASLHQSENPSDRAYLPQRIVYVSCNPATLARDVGILVHTAGYHLKQAGVVNMFPHTSHIESIAIFERSERS
jgi:23S rRNA (uracil1939-C5)-methyltransferase